MDNTELKKEADLLIQQCKLAELLAAYPDWFIGGSYSYDLMCWRDLDIYVLDPPHDLKQCFEVGFELTKRLAAKKSGGVLISGSIHSRKRPMKNQRGTEKRHRPFSTLSRE